jgi:hypothetical protein
LQTSSTGSVNERPVQSSTVMLANLSHALLIWMG